jgi:hypothetical protein
MSDRPTHQEDTMNTTELTEGQIQAIERVEKNLLDGHYFTLIANSNRSVPLGGAPINSRHWAGIMKAVATYAASDNRAAATAHKIFGRINLYLTPNEVIAQVATVLAEVVREGYFDVIGATGPEAGRRSAHQHPTDLRAALYLALLMSEVEMNAGYIGHVPGVGWVIQHLVERENVTVYACYLPCVSEKLADAS